MINRFCCICPLANRELEGVWLKCGQYHLLQSQWFVWTATTCHIKIFLIYPGDFDTCNTIQYSHHQLHNPNCTKNVVYLWLVAWAAAIKYFGLLMGFYSKWQPKYFSSWSCCISCMGMVSCIFYSNTYPYMHMYMYIL